MIILINIGKQHSENCTHLTLFDPKTAEADADHRFHAILDYITSASLWCILILYYTMIILINIGKQHSENCTHLTSFDPKTAEADADHRFHAILDYITSALLWCIHSVHINIILYNDNINQYRQTILRKLYTFDIIWPQNSRGRCTETVQKCEDAQ